MNIRLDDSDEGDTSGPCSLPVGVMALYICQSAQKEKLLHRLEHEQQRMNGDKSWFDVAQG